MKEAFDGVCQGSLELLADRELYWIARNLRYGYDVDYRETMDDSRFGMNEEDGDYGE